MRRVVEIFSRTSLADSTRLKGTDETAISSDLRTRERTTEALLPTFLVVVPSQNVGVLRRRMKEVLEVQLASMPKMESASSAYTTSFDFGEIADESVDHYVVERLEIEVPEVHPLTA